MTLKDTAKRARWKAAEQANTKAVLLKVRPALEALGLSASSRSRRRYEVQINGYKCIVGIQKLSLAPTFRIHASIEGKLRLDLVSDPFTHAGHPSGLKFKLDVSRFEDNSEDCAAQITSFVRLAALPWFRDNAL